MRAFGRTLTVECIPSMVNRICIVNDFGYDNVFATLGTMINLRFSAILAPKKWWDQEVISN